MKLISFNIWGATLGQKLFEYINSQSETTDIFCFQEVFSALKGAPEESSGARMFLFDELLEILPDFNGFFNAKSQGYDFYGKVNSPVSHGLAVFVRKAYSVYDYRSEIIGIPLNTKDPVEGRPQAQVFKLLVNNKPLFVINFHGVALPGDKLDTQERLEHITRLGLIWQSLGVGAKILCGDFNLYPETESIKYLDVLGKNLIKSFNIQNTRNEVSWAKYPGSRQTFADYTFVSPEIKVKNFEVPYNEVSDHLPMILEFQI